MKEPSGYTLAHSESPAAWVRFDEPAEWILVVRVLGELDVVTVPPLRAALDEHRRRTRPCRLVLDLAGVTLLCPAALALLLELHHDTRESDQHLILVEPGTARCTDHCGSPGSWRCSTPGPSSSTRSRVLPSHGVPRVPRVVRSRAPRPPEREFRTDERQRSGGRPVWPLPDPPTPPARPPVLEHPMSLLRRSRTAPSPRRGGVEHVIDHLLRDVAHGRFERSLSGLTAISAVVTGAEVYLEHYKGSFGNKWMWSPVLLTPPLVVAGIGGVFSKRWAKTALPITAGLYTANGLLGEYFHARGVARKPGGWRLWSYNLPMGPPISAPGLMSMVGGMGLLAAILRRER